MHARKKELKTERFQLCMEKSVIDAIDNWGFENRIRSRAEATRMLVRLGLSERKETKKAEARA